MIFSTELVIDVSKELSKARFCKESVGDAHFDVAPQKSIENCKKTQIFLILCSFVFFCVFRAPSVIWS